MSGGRTLIGSSDIELIGNGIGLIGFLGAEFSDDELSGSSAGVLFGDEAAFDWIVLGWILLGWIVLGWRPLDGIAFSWIVFGWIEFGLIAFSLIAFGWIFDRRPFDGVILGGRLFD